jgi:hypothetical protein
MIRIRNPFAPKKPRQMFETGVFKNRRELEDYVRHILATNAFLAYYMIHVYPDNTILATFLWE